MSHVTIANGVLNPYTIRPRNLTAYKAFRGVTDFTQIGQFAQFETGYSFLSVIEMPKFMTALADELGGDFQDMVNSFKHMLEYEFRGLEGIPDITAETYTITDGINEQMLINKVTRDTSITVSSNYFEKTGSLITRFCESYLTGIKDPMTQAKTYHGLIRHNKMAPGPENEVFTMLYYVTDSTMLRLERAVLLCNCQLTKAETSMYSSTKGDINNKEMTIEWNCFPIMSSEVDKAACVLLTDITGNGGAYNNKGEYDYDCVKDYDPSNEGNDGFAALDSGEFRFAAMRKNAPQAKSILVDAVK